MEKEIKTHKILLSWEKPYSAHHHLSLIKGNQTLHYSEVFFFLKREIFQTYGNKLSTYHLLLGVSRPLSLRAQRALPFLVSLDLLDNK